MSLSHAQTTSYLLENLHCPSCVFLIKGILQDAFGDRILWVSPNIVTSIVTVEHKEKSPSLIRSIGKTLQDVGFQIAGLDSTVDVGVGQHHPPQQGDIGQGALDIMSPEDGELDGWSGLLLRGLSPHYSPEIARETHLSNCKACQLSVNHTAEAATSQAVQAASSPPLASSKTQTPETKELAGIVTDAVGGEAPCWKVSVSIGGMTCASCANTITEQLDKLPWVSKATVNLVGNSATVELVGSDRSSHLVEAIEDMGFDASIDKVVNASEEKKSSGEREVEIQIDGLFCSRCPERIVRTVEALRPKRVLLLQKPSLDRPIMKLRYTPDAPHFTVRHILRGISATDPSLVPRIYHPPTLEERSRAIRAKHSRQLFLRALLTLVMAIPTFVLGIVYMSLVPESNAARKYLMRPWRSGLSRIEVILFALATPVYFLAADIFHTRAIKELRTLWRPSSRTPLLKRFYRFGSMNMLMSLGTTIAYVSSIAQMIAAAVDSDVMIPEDRFYFDSVVFLTLFLLAGRLIEAYSKSKTGDAVEALAKLRPAMALLVEADDFNGRTVTNIDRDQLDSGDLIRVLHGSSPPVDGVVVTGETKVDESSLTGESRLVKKGEGDELFAGTVNKGDAVTVRVTGTCGKSMLDQIVEVVREGQTKRAPMEQIADLMTSYFVPVITAIAIITWAVWMALALTHSVSSDELNGPGSAVAFAFQFAIAVFVVACPCGLALAAPTAIFVGGGIAAQNGILAKGGGEAFEKASKVGYVVFDKTGTLTVGGEPQITDSVMLAEETEGNANVLDDTRLLAGLKAVEESSSHPIARAIVDFCSKKSDFAESADSVEELPGRGMRATLKSTQTDIAVGNERLLRDLAVTISGRAGDLLDAWKREGKSVALVATKARDDTAWILRMALSVSDPIRDEAIPVIKSLQKRGMQVWMLSGDNVTTAQAVARRVGIPTENVLAEVLPSEKAAKIRYLQATAHVGVGAGAGAAQGCREPQPVETNGEGGVNDELGSSTKHRRRVMVAMVGDGINDSPALTTADVGIAIGSGSDVAISSADFVLATSKLQSVLTLLDLSRAVFGRIKVNFGWAAVYNVLAVPIAAGCLYAIETPGGSHVKLDPVWASLAMALSSISVVLSSLSLRSGIPGVGFRRKQG